MIKKKTTEMVDIAAEYAQALLDIKKQIQEAQTRAILTVNKELLKLYWSIGKIIADRQRNSVWGSKIIEKLANDLQNSFPGTGGFSKPNISRMRAFYLAYEIVSQAAIQLEELPIFNIPWFHNMILLHKLKNNEERLWYAKKSIEHGWSRSVLEMQIESDLYGRQGKAITNFKAILPASHSDMAQQSFKDPYIFDFLVLQDKHLEHDIEIGLIDNVQQLLLEMGKGFSFVGRQYHIEIGGDDFYIDLLFYHYKLRCFVVVELKATAFDHRDLGQLQFYLSTVDNMIRQPDDKPTIGLLLCKSKNNLVVEYALQATNKPIGVAEFTTEITKHLPKELRSSLPSIEEIEAEFEKQELLQQLQKN